MFAIPHIIMEKKDSIINYYLRVTKDSYVKRQMAVGGNFSNLNYKMKVDEQIMLCEFCEKLWIKLSQIYSITWNYFPKNSIPTIGKKRKPCPKCSELQ